MEESMNKNEKTMKPFRVLTIDGGGMRGLYTASLLNFLVKRFDSDVINPDIGKSFDLICGTSTGANFLGLLALCIFPKSPRSLFNICL